MLRSCLVLGKGVGFASVSAWFFATVPNSIHGGPTRGSFIVELSLACFTTFKDGENWEGSPTSFCTFSFSQVISIQLCDSFDNFPMVMLMTSVLQDEMLTREINSVVCGSSLLRWNRPWYPRRCCDWLLGWYVHTPEISVPKAKSGTNLCCTSKKYLLSAYLYSDWRSSSMECLFCQHLHLEDSSV